MLWHDLKYAARTLIKGPGFAVVAVLSLAIGIGANAAVFSAVRAVLLRPPPFPDPDAIVTISTTTDERPNLAWGASAPPDFGDWRRDARSFSEMAAINVGASALTGTGPAEQVPSANVTGGFFAVLGVQAVAGRTLAPDDDPPGAPNVAVLSHELWTRRFGQSRSVLGETIEIDSQRFRVVGVMPEGFSYPLGTELWIPQRFSEEELRTQRGAQYLDVIARLEDGTTLAAAESELIAYAGRLAELYPRTNKDRTLKLHLMREALVGDVGPAMLLMLGAVGFVLLIVCVNVANLVLTRAVGRQRELAVRTALGAGRGRLVRGLLVESALLAGIGAATGLVAAVWATRAIARLDEGIGIPLLDQTRVDSVVAIFTVGVAALAAVLFGTLPAWHASRRLDVARSIREDSGTTTGDRQRHRLRGGLIVAETALAVVLLIGAGLLMRSFIGLASVELGMAPDRVQTFNVSLPDAAYPTPIARSTVVQTFLARVAAHPDVESAGAIFGLPLTNFRYGITMSTLDGRKLDDDEQTERALQVRVVTPDYFRAMGIPVRRGRPIDESDGQGSMPVVVVNEAAAGRLWPGESRWATSSRWAREWGRGRNVPEAGWWEWSAMSGTSVQLHRSARPSISRTGSSRSPSSPLRSRPAASHRRSSALYGRCWRISTPTCRCTASAPWTSAHTTAWRSRGSCSRSSPCLPPPRCSWRPSGSTASWLTASASAAARSACGWRSAPSAAA